MDGTYINASTPREAVEAFYGMLTYLASRSNDRRRVFESFKMVFAPAAGRAWTRSSDLSWAATDLESYMHSASANPVVFIETLHEAINSIGNDMLDPKELPPDAALNKVLSECKMGYRVEGNRLLNIEQAPPLPAQDPSAALREAAARQGISEIRLFVSSPGDCRPYREAAIRVCRAVSQRLGLTVRPILWEGGGREYSEVVSIPPIQGIGSPQAVIDDHLFEQLRGYDIYVGIIWHRMGSVTAGFRSGTEAEYRKALEWQHSRQRPKVVLFYRVMASPGRIDDIDPTQLATCRAFAKELEDQNLVKRVDSLAEFESELAGHLEEAVITILDARAQAVGTQAPAATVPELVSQIEAAVISPKATNSLGFVRCPACGSDRLAEDEDVDIEVEQDEGGGARPWVSAEFPRVTCEACGWSKSARESGRLGL